MSSISFRTIFSEFFNPCLFCRKNNKVNSLLTCRLFLIVLGCAALQAKIVLADDLISLIQLQRNSSNILLILDTGNSVNFELIHLESKGRLFLDLYNPDYYEELHNFFFNISKNAHKPCILDIQVKQHIDSTQLIIDINDGLLVNINKEKTNVRDRHRITLNVFTDPPVSNACATTVKKNIEKKRDAESSVLANKRTIENDRNKMALTLVRKTTKSSSFEFGAYAMYDYISGIGESNDWDEILKKKTDRALRRFKVTAKGVVGKWNYVFGLSLKDVLEPKDKIKIYRGYIGYNTFQSLRVSFGLQPEPFGVDKSTSSNYLTFMERSLPIVFMPQDNLGLLLSASPSSVIFVDVGIYKERTWPEGGDIKNAFTGRIGYTPVNSKRRLFYTGLSFSARKPKKDILRFRARPEAKLAEKLYDSGKIADVRKIRVINFETAVVYDSLSLQGEYLRSTLLFNGQMQDQTASSYYIYSSVFLTGESRRYARGNFGRVKPRKKVGKGIGAWELGIRRSNIDGYNDQQLSVTTYGVNWYLNKYSRLMLNVINTTHTQNSINKRGKLYEIRFQLKI